MRYRVSITRKILRILQSWGGGKDGKTGRFALVFVGGKINESLIVYQTGSVLISDLAGTSGGSTGIKPASNGYLRVFEIGGKVF